MDARLPKVGDWLRIKGKMVHTYFYFFVTTARFAILPPPYVYISGYRLCEHKFNESESTTYVVSGPWNNSLSAPSLNLEIITDEDELAMLALIALGSPIRLQQEMIDDSSTA